MESSEVVREKEHPFAKKMDHSSYFSCINGFMSFTVFSQEAYPFFTRYCNRDTR